MIRVGIVGIGFMGWIHYLAYQKTKGVKLAAICTRDDKKLAGDWTDIKGNFGPPGKQVDLKGIGAYAEYNQLLADPEIDLVDLCLPPHLHASAAIAAFKAGKHVFVEKPMALTAADCDKMVKAAQQAGKQIFVGHVLPLLPEYAVARKLIDSGKYGKLLGGHFQRVISDPLWLKDFFDPNKAGGPAVDLHVHDAHFIRLLFGMPTTVTSQGRMRGEVAEYFNTQFTFSDPDLAVTATSGIVRQQGRSFTHGFEIHLEKATLYFNLAVLADKPLQITPLTLLDSKGAVEHPALPAGDPMLTAFEAEIKEVATCLKNNKPSAILGGELARDAIVLALKQQESVKKRKPVKV
ncbi:Glucose--fructose oxidoreductase precursor [Anatilimnocola aggregata]|uniref:Glucose--fructose oxidoreductase n=1 Tax=Anatilimnocola aggregata TaxID=2528021 RepID=A0A517YNQ5_9BACT|nr:Gfo/Idh/MocA family oxidoreductase [Anatilimnocola aggregata]QDU31862.1 Glucose--fructose oxidoreductase precursor [Anatilimnocola aggregata]